MAEHPAMGFLAAAWTRAEKIAKAATPGPWEPEGDDPTDDEVYTVHDGEHGDLVGNPVAYVRGGMIGPDSGRTQANMRLIASFANPVSVLRRVAAERRILAEHQAREERHQCCRVCISAREDLYPEQWESDRWPCRTVLLLAQAWGWEETA